MRKRSKVKNVALCGLVILIISAVAFPANSEAASGTKDLDVAPHVFIYRQSKQDVSNRSLAGTWQGVLDVGSAKLRLVLNITRQSDGSYQATLDSVDQDAKGIAVDSATLKGADVRLELKAIGSIYEGAMDAEGATIIGNWSQGGAKLPLTFSRSDKPIAAPARPQVPNKPYPYHEEQVSYENKRAGVRLNATLTLPREKGPHPAVLLITGSGMQDRDETVAGHKPFLILAHHLTLSGLAVLRADDRGWGVSPAEFMKATSADFAEDALAGVEFLKTRKEINPKKIGLIGHSEGGIIAPLAAVKSADVAFLVLLAGPGLPGERLLELQSERLLKASGLSDETIAQHGAMQRLMLTALREEKTDDAVERRVRASLPKLLGQMPAEQRSALGISDAMLEGQLKLMMTPWYRSLIAYDPRPTLMKVKVPVLAVGGERDLQVPAKENLQAISDALKAGGNRDFKTLELPRLNHLFQTSQTGLPTEYSQIEETMAPAAMKTISDWIQLHVLAPLPKVTLSNR